MSNEELLVRIKEFQTRGNVTFNPIFDEFEKFIKYKAGKYRDFLGRGIEFEDLLQVGAIGLWSAVRNYGEGSDKLRTYILRSIENSMIDLLNIKRLKKNISNENSITMDKTVTLDSDLTLKDVLVSGDILTLEYVIIRDEYRNIIETIKNNIYILSPLEREVFELTMKDLTIKEISFATNSTPASVRSMQYTARKKFKKLLSN